MRKVIKVVFTVVDDDKLDRPIFRRIGTGFVNHDDTLNIVLDALPVSGRLHVRDVDTRRGRREEAKSGNPLSLLHDLRGLILGIPDALLHSFPVGFIAEVPHSLLELSHAAGCAIDFTFLVDPVFEPVRAAAGKLHRQRGSPGTGADNGNLLVGSRSYQCFSASADSCCATCC